MSKQAGMKRFLVLPENRSAVAALQDLRIQLGQEEITPAYCPLFLHGPAGSGKTTIFNHLTQEIYEQTRGMSWQRLVANDWPLHARSQEPFSKKNDPLQELRQADLLIVEDFQHLPASARRDFMEVLDHRTDRHLPTIVSASRGPAHLPGSAQLTSRLAAGLVVALDSWQAQSRLLFLEESAQRLQLAVPPDVFPWIAQHLTSGGRQLEGAIQQLQALTRHHKKLDLAQVQEYFRVQAEADRPTVERIVRQVSGHFQVDPNLLQSKNRFRKILLPRQISMYLARLLTPLSLGQIGQYFGGRDHSTVLHACRKVETALTQDVALSGTIRQLHAELA